MNKARLSWELLVTCPECLDEFDVVAQDSENDSVIALKVFNNDWDAVAGCDVMCPQCGAEFQLDGVEY